MAHGTSVVAVALDAINEARRRPVERLTALIAHGFLRNRHKLAILRLPSTPVDQRAMSFSMPTHRDSILLTGGTGFLGGAVAAELLTSPQWSRAVLLIRASTPIEGMARLTANLQRFGVYGAALSRISPEQIICGDITDPAAFAGDQRLAAITKVLKCAAVTSFGSHPKIWQTNVDGT